MKDRILVTGANGQLGTVLVEALIQKYGWENVFATDIKIPELNHHGISSLDVLDNLKLERFVFDKQITIIYHLAAILSARGEAEPLKTWDINMKAWLNVLEAARKLKVKKVFYPSSIAVFGDSAPKNPCKQNAVTEPTTVYGISKVAGENWAQYYHKRYGLDVRSLRYPGVISYQSMPGGGTTDYAVEIFHAAIKKEKYNCFLKANATLPMIYTDDAIRATLELMDAPKDNIKIRTSYNLAGVSFSPEEIFENIKKSIPDFEIEYQPDFRQQIAESWPQVMDDSNATNDWNWRPDYDLNKMTGVMIENLKVLLGKEKSVI
ncbi:MAG: NAD-dependent epimerase/dehydratase family protein [Cytophagaceae bacterium]|nr:NAD-dependent epimerase/dehydratase family protein [Cytophagaceae bacterium]MBL0326920.1 NAD-dependent epimerase/dehydratase family protein [Cytophagaceae bacterium]